MSSSLLGKAISVANTYVNVYTVPSTGVEFATVSVNIVNTGPAVANIDVAIATSPVPTIEDVIGWKDEVVNDGGSVEYNCYLMFPGESLYIRSTNSNTVIRAHGLIKEPF